MPIRRARPDDIAACIALRGRTRENAIPAERLAALGITEASWSAQVAADALPGFVAEIDGQMAGTCFGSAASGEVIVLALLPAHEDRGLGKALLGAVVAALRTRGHARLFLGCSDDPAHRSHGFCRHLGWRSTGERDGRGDDILEYVLDAPPAA